MRQFLLLVAAFIIYGSLYPWNFHWTPGADPIHVVLTSWPAQWTRYELRDYVENVLLYMPLGAAALFAFSRRRSRPLAAIAGAAMGISLSITIELLQVYVPGRDPSLADIAANSLGTILGVAGALVFHGEIPGAGIWKARRQNWPAIFLIGCWIGFELYPFIPVLSRYRIGVQIRYLLQHPVPSAVGIWTSTAEWFALALALRSLRWDPRVTWLAPMILLSMRVMIPERFFSASDVVGVAVFILLWLILRDAWRLRAGLFLTLSAIVLIELSPFQFAPPPASFSWIPFGSSFESDAGSALVVLLRKAFLYGSAVWFLALAGVRYRTAAAVVAGGLFILEMAQRYLPGRSPEITDSMLALALAFVLARLSDSRQPQR